MAFFQTPGGGRRNPNTNSYQTPSSFSPTSARRSPNQRFSPRNKQLPKTDAPLIAEISRADLGRFLTSEETIITDYEHLASYNWLEALTPTIAVPGAPSLYNPPAAPPKPTPDSGKTFIDQNAARNPNSPLESLFRSLFTLKPNFNISKIDLVTDRNNIRKLLKFISGDRDPFEIKVECVGEKTTLFTRVSSDTVMHANGKGGYGHNFENAITKDQVGTGHHRIISYQFGGIKMVVRYEVDGYVDEKHDQFGQIDFEQPAGFAAEPGPGIKPSLETSQTHFASEKTVVEESKATKIEETAKELNVPDTPSTPNQPRRDPRRKAASSQNTDTLPNLLESLSNLSIGDPTAPKSITKTTSTLNPGATPYKLPSQRGVQIQALGTSTPSSQILEIKSRMDNKPFPWSNTLPQLWVSQTPYLLIGYHSNGCFDKIELNDMLPAIQEWEEMNQENLSKLAGLIKWIIEKVKSIDGKRGTVRFEGGNVIKVMGLGDETSTMTQSPMMMSKHATKKDGKMRKMVQRRALPDDLYEKWSTTNDEANENEELGYGNLDDGGVLLGRDW